MAGRTAKASKAVTPQEPSGWLTVNQALSWIAFRSLAPNWDTAFYFGASNWFTQSPDDMLAYLNEMIGEPSESLFRRMRYRPEFEGRIRVAAAALRQSDNTPADPAGTIDDDARILLNHLSAHLPDARQHRVRIQEAAEVLRRAIASDQLPAFGWQGEGPDPAEPHAAISQARERIRADACAGPVTVAELGIVPIIASDEGSAGYALVWSGLQIPSDEVVRLWPASHVGIQPKAPLIEPQASPGDTAEQEPARRPQFSEQALAAWYLLRVRCWPGDAPPPTADADLRAAREHFEGDIPRSAIRKIRKEKAEPEWLKPGPRKPG